MYMTPQKYYARPFKSGLLLLLSLAFVVILIALFVGTMKNGDYRHGVLVGLISLIGVPFFGIGVVWFGWLIVGYIIRKPLLVIDETGLIDNTDLLEYGQKMSWNDFSEVRLMEFTNYNGRHSSKQIFVCLKLIDPEKTANRAKKWQRHLMGVNRTMMGKDYFYITTAFMNVKPKELLSVINQYSLGKISVIDDPEAVEATVAPKNIPQLIMTGEGAKVNYAEESKGSNEQPPQAN